jgi:hypothetical protein
MNKLPTGVFERITSYLSFADKLNCACVNKNWNKRMFENTLYRILIFRSKEIFDQAVNLLTTKDFGKYVRSLIVDDMDYSLQVLLSLPTLFPNLVTLYWRDHKPHNSRRNIEDVNAMTYTQIAEQWANLETLVDLSSLISISTLLPKSFTFSKLTGYDCFINDYTNSGNGIKVWSSEKLKDLVNNIQNVIAIRELTLRETSIELSDIQILQSGLRQLKEITLGILVYMMMIEQALIYNTQVLLNLFH